MSGAGSMGEATVALGNSAVTVSSAPVVGAAASPQAGATPPAADSSLPLQAGGDARTAAQGASAPSAKHTATIAQPSKPQAFAKQTEGPGVGGAVFALILVVSLILALGWLAKRMPGFGRATGGGNALRVVGSLTLGPRDRVVVVDVGGTQLLLGVGQSGMTTLHTLAQPLPVAQPSQGNPGLQHLATPFAQLLQKHLGKKP